MHTFLAALALSLCLLAPAAAQSFTPGAHVDLSAVTQGRPYSIWAVDVDPAFPGDELIIDFYSDNRITVARYHPSKHGPQGSLPGAGVCAEAETSTAPAWRAAGDLNGDGKADFLLYWPDGMAVPQFGVGFTTCR
jgi:hypothetical protein